MVIGTTKEIKNHEYRVGLIPDNVEVLVKDGHTVYVETNAEQVLVLRMRCTPPPVPPS